MKRLLIVVIILIAAATSIPAQQRLTARGASPAEFYLTDFWYGIYNPYYPIYYDTLQIAIYRLTENGKKLTIQYDADYFANPEIIMTQPFILADATPGVLYSSCSYSKNDYNHTAFWVSFDYGKNWTFREENSGSKGYFPANVEGIIYRAEGIGGMFKSNDYGQNFVLLENISRLGKESGLSEEEFFSVYGSYPIIPYTLLHTYDLITYTEIPIDEEIIGGQIGTLFPDVYRGSLPGEVYISSWFPDYSYKVSFSADTGYTFRHVYICEECNPYLGEQIRRYFMSDREAGVFYIIHFSEVMDTNPLGHHTKICIDYFRDYGEILEATFCHDLTKDYVYEEITCNHTTVLHSEVVNLNSIRLQWSNAADNIRGYHVFRDNARITNELLTEPTYLDEYLQKGEYKYYVRTYYEIGCASDSSNHVTESIENEICKAVSDLASEKISDNSILLTWSEPENDLPVIGYTIYRNNTLLTEEPITTTSFKDEHLQKGEYEYYVITYYKIICTSDKSNHVTETIENEICKAVSDLASEKISDNSILLTWSEPENDLPVNGYTIYRNHTLLTEEPITTTSYTDENLPVGNYEYYVITYYEIGCISDTSNRVIETIGVGIASTTLSNQIEVYPNPTGGMINVQCLMINVQNIEIFDVMGRKVYEQKAESRKQKENLTVLRSYDLTVFPAGVYFIRITTEYGVVTKKIVKRE